MDNLTPSTPIERHVRDKAPSQILPFLYVGAEGHAHDAGLLRELGITYILNLTTRDAIHVDGIEYHTIPIRVSGGPCARGESHLTSTCLLGLLESEPCYSV
jgi:hypothetical protein